MADTCTKEKGSLATADATAAPHPELSSPGNVPSRCTNNAQLFTLPLTVMILTQFWQADK